MVEVNNVSKQFGGKVVLEETSVKIQKGKITSFIGPNGAGKSTLLSMMSRLIKKDSGEIFIDGHEIGSCDSKELAKKMSIVKQANQ
ncbi:ATP-binding cassette domain-containing protein, partial [Bacillus vallismortis]|nr:ATP-binding cassette domain-containing protein [Bacillus vallismortis]